jgi:NAD(P)-dependent dehydrogenase (short-subunit alcohol dehydrogenase family)
MNIMSKVWYMTGTSRGFGRAWAHAALARGDKVAATARNTDSLKDLVESFGDDILPIALDVTDREASIAALQAAHKHFGRLDIVVNNAGYGHFGMVEETTEQEARAQMETNFFGALWTTQAAIPLLRGQRGGHLVQVSSMSGVVAFPSVGLYSASKWALEGMTEALAREVAPFGIKTTLIEPGPYGTEWRGGSATHSEHSPVYKPFRDVMAANNPFGPPPQAADTVEALFAAIDADQPPTRLIFGSTGYDMVVTTSEKRIQTWRDWEKVSRSADGAKSAVKSAAN